MVQFESSGKWPDDLKALRRVKASLVIDISEKLSETGLPTKVGKEWLDVYHGGYVFRLYIAVRKEVMLMRQKKVEGGLKISIKSENADELEERNEIVPKVTSALNALNRSHSSYSCVVRLAKRWIASQLLADYFTDLTVELIVASLYISPAPYEFVPK